MELRDRVVLVTGAKRVGAAVAVALAERGADVALTYNRSRTEAEAAADAVRRRGRRAITIAADLSQPANGATAVAQTVEQLGRLDVLICMASIYQSIPLGELTVAQFEESLAVHLTSTFTCAQAAIPHLRRAGDGAIITCSDWLPASARPRYPGFLQYYVAKAGVGALTEALALELAPDGIRVNAIAPGPILAPPDLTPADAEEVARATPLGRWGGSDAIVRAVLALLDLDFVTGETLRVDGGRHLR